MNDAALRAWRVALGDANVSTDAAALRAAARATFSTHATIPAILRPVDTAQVGAVLRIAADHAAPVYPVSRGRNWGFGSRVPAADGCALLDLSRMDRIVEFDDRLAYAVLEPGVTFTQLHDFLRAQRASCFMPRIGGPADASVIGNTLERGDAASAYGDRPAHVCNLEVVLAGGEIVRTGYGRFPGAAAAHTSRYGVGPALDGLFFQSNLGVVTRMTAWLQPVPKALGQFTGRIAGTEALAAFVDALRPLALEETVRPNTLGIWNFFKLAGLVGRTAALDAVPREAWHFSGTLHAASVQLAAGGLLRAASLRGSSVHWQQRIVENPEEVWDEHFRPSDLNVGSTYWRKASRPARDLDPDRDGCGVLWLCPEFPLDGALVASAIGELEAVVARHGFEPNLGLVLSGARSMRAYLALMYDRDVAGEDARALACHDEALEAMSRRGILSYRLGLHSMQTLAPSAALRVLKDVLDPKRVIAPGRYE
jgi:4-cresol dehydrogenase (hydroxylating) flavoprotein subunit